MRITTAAAVVLALAATSARAAAQAPKITWGPAPAVFPPGAKFAVLQGDPSKPAMYTVRLDLPNGYTVAPHSHPTDENITVISGDFLVGMGTKIEPAKMMSIPQGGFITAAANMQHYARAKGRTIVQVSGIGPFAMTYANPADDPTRKK